MSAALQEATVQQQCKQLRLPAVAAQCVRLAEQAVRERQTHLRYLEALLASELEERERNTIERRLREARLPRMKTLEEFDYSQSPKISPSEIQALAAGDYIGLGRAGVLYGVRLGGDDALYCIEYCVHFSVHLALEFGAGIRASEAAPNDGADSWNSQFAGVRILDGPGQQPHECARPAEGTARLLGCWGRGSFRGSARHRGGSRHGP